MWALASGNAVGSEIRMLIVCSSTTYDAVISRALGATLTLKGVSASAAACCSDQFATDCSAAVMTGGEIYHALVFILGDLVQFPKTIQIQVGHDLQTSRSMVRE